MIPQAPAGASYEGGDGSSIEHAIIIRGASESTGIHAEYAWLGFKFPGHRLGAQVLYHRGGKSYDAIEFLTADGKPTKVYFDISDFYGKD